MAPPVWVRRGATIVERCYLRTTRSHPRASQGSPGTARGTEFRPSGPVLPSAPGPPSPRPHAKDPPVPRGSSSAHAAYRARSGSRLRSIIRASREPLPTRGGPCGRFSVAPGGLEQQRGLQPHRARHQRPAVTAVETLVSDPEEGTAPFALAGIVGVVPADHREGSEGSWGIIIRTGDRLGKAEKRGTGSLEKLPERVGAPFRRSSSWREK